MPGRHSNPETKAREEDLFVVTYLWVFILRSDGFRGPELAALATKKLREPWPTIQRRYYAVRQNPARFGDAMSRLARAWEREGRCVMPRVLLADMLARLTPDEAARWRAFPGKLRSAAPEMRAQLEREREDMLRQAKWRCQLSKDDADYAATLHRTQQKTGRRSSLSRV